MLDDHCMATNYISRNVLSDCWDIDMMKNNTVKIFVYGTLKKGGRFSTSFDNFRISVKEAKASGIMYNVNNAYPAAIFGKGGVITGELHEYSHAKEVISLLDAIEGYIDENSNANLYNRIMVEVTTNDGKEKCLAYEFARSVSKLKKIENGEWRV